MRACVWRVTLVFCSPFGLSQPGRHSRWWSVQWLGRDFMPDTRRVTTVICPSLDRTSSEHMPRGTNVMSLTSDILSMNQAPTFFLSTRPRWIGVVSSDFTTGTWSGGTTPLGLSFVKLSDLDSRPLLLDFVETELFGKLTDGFGITCSSDLSRDSRFLLGDFSLVSFFLSSLVGDSFDCDEPFEDFTMEDLETERIKSEKEIIAEFKFLLYQKRYKKR